VFPTKTGIAEQLLYNGLTVVKRTVDGNVVNICIQHRGHLCFLNRGYASFRVQDKHPETNTTGWRHETPKHPGATSSPNILFAPQPLNGSRSRVAAGSSHHSDPTTITRQQILKQVANELKRNVLEGARGAMELLKQVRVVRAFHLSSTSIPACNSAIRPHKPTFTSGTTSFERNVE
jgi:hypothetical protein